MRWSFSSWDCHSYNNFCTCKEKWRFAKHCNPWICRTERIDVLYGSHTSDSESLSRAVFRPPALFLAAVEVSESSCLYFQRDGEPRRLAAWLLAPMLSPIPTPSPSPIPHAITRSMMLSSQGNDCSLGTTHEPEPA